MQQRLLLFFFFLGIMKAYAQEKPFYYDNIYPFHDGYSLVSLNGKFGIINNNFQEVIPPVLESINNFDLSDYYFEGILYGVLNDSTILFDTLGNRVKAYPDPKIYPQRKISTYSIDSLSIFGVRGGKGCSDPNGKLIVPYENLYIYKGLAEHIIACKEIEIDSFDTSGNWFPFDKKVTNVYDRDGNIIYQQDGRIFCWPEASIYLVEKSGKYEITNAQFEKIHPETFNRISITDSLCWVNTNSGWGLMDTKFEYKIDPQFSYLYVNQYWSAVKKDDKFGFINRAGKQISKLEYDGEWTQYTGDDKIIVAYKKDHLVFLNLEGECIHSCDKPQEHLKIIDNGSLIVEGQFENYRKTGVWKYYRSDMNNSIWKTIEYHDSVLVYNYFDSKGLVSDSWKEKRMLTY